MFFATRSRHAGGGGFLPTIGTSLGVIGTALCVWTLLAFYFPSTVPATLSIRSVYSAQVVPAVAPPIQGSRVVPASRVVQPFESANVTAPAQQLRANLRHVIFSVGAVLIHERDHGTLPSSLSVDPDGLIRSTGASYSKIAPCMAVTSGVVSGPAGFTLTITDTLSGMAESVDPVTRGIIDR